MKVTMSNDEHFELEDTVHRIGEKLLKKMETAIDQAPTGLVTEMQDKKTGETFKLADLVQSFINVAGRPVDVPTVDPGWNPEQDAPE